MRTFTAAGEPIHTLSYSADSRLLALCSRGEPTPHPFMAHTFRPARELVWYDWLTGTVRGRFRLRDSLYGPQGVLTGSGCEDRSPCAPALDASFCLHPWRVATAWEWTNKEDGVCVFDLGRHEVTTLETPYKTHVENLALAPDGTRLAVATVNDMDGSRLLEAWNLTAQPANDPDPNAPGPPVGLDRLRQRRVRQSQEGCPNPFRKLAALAFDGRYLAAAAAEESKILLWDSHAPPPVPDGGGGNSAAAVELPDEVRRQVEAIGRQFPAGVLAPPGGRAEQGRPLKEAVMDLGFVPVCLAFAPREPLLAVAGEGLVVHRCADRQRTDLDRSGQPVNAVAFSADGRSLLAGTRDGMVELWDLPGRRQRGEFDWGYGPVTAVALAPDGHTCAAGTHAGRVLVWDMDG